MSEWVPPRQREVEGARGVKHTCELVVPLCVQEEVGLDLAHEDGDGGGRGEARLGRHHGDVADGRKVVAQVDHVEGQRGVAAAALRGGRVDRMRVVRRQGDRVRLVCAGA